MHGLALVAILRNEIRSIHPKGKRQTHLRLIGEFSCHFVASLNVTADVAVCASLMFNALDLVAG